jgi:hypothetical protein
VSFISNNPTVSGIKLADPNPTNSNNVNYTVTFNENVSGVDPTDFTLTSTGLMGASITGVTGIDNTYNVSVNTGTGDGILGLNIVDDDSINNSLFVPLGGNGEGNGDFTGETYTVDQTLPTVTFDPVTPDPRNSSVSTIPITFSEPVTGFEIADLSLTQNGVPVPLTGATLSTRNNTNWILDNLTGLTSSDGNYQLSLTATASGIADLAGNSLNTNASNTWSSDFTLPIASTSLTNINTAGGTNYNFTVTYSDNTAVNVTSLDSNNILVTGPDGKSQPATLVNFTPLGNGTPRAATYSFIPPGDAWDTADHGIYTVQLQAKQVSDTVNNFGVAGNLGAFTVDIASTATPIVETATPIVETPTPIVETPTPIVETATPIVETATPIVETPTPIVETPTPILRRRRRLLRRRRRF